MKALTLTLILASVRVTCWESVNGDLICTGSDGSRMVCWQSVDGSWNCNTRGT